jgi:hypothetical protein
MGKSSADLQPQFVVALGDNVYEDGVKSVDDPQWQTKFEKVGRSGTCCGKGRYIGLKTQVRNSRAKFLRDSITFPGRCLVCEVLVVSLADVHRAGAPGPVVCPSREPW